MKNIYLALIAVYLFSSLSFGQSLKLGKALTPIRGHYKELAIISTKAKSPREKIDQQKFPYDSIGAARRLSLKPTYLVKVSLHDFKIPDPPANSSAQTRAEIDYLLALQNQRSKLDVESSLYMANVYYNLRIKPTDSTYSRFRSNLFFIGRSVGTWFNANDLPVTADVMAKVWQDASFFMWSFKYKFLRIRPYVVNPALKNLENTDWAAYPSGHAFNSYVNAYIYQELAPEFTDVFVKDAYDMAHSREILGVHYPSDSESSRALARQFVNKLLENETFKKDFEQIKKEWSLKAK
ncbi:MAG: phosphatase [Chryseolinea sp.]